MARIQVVLDVAENEALFRLARAELREPRDQIRVILREELQRRGLLNASMQQSRKAGRDEAKR